MWKAAFQFLFCWINPFGPRWDSKVFAIKTKAVTNIHFLLCFYYMRYDFTIRMPKSEGTFLSELVKAASEASKPEWGTWSLLPNRAEFSMSLPSPPA